MIPTRIGQRAPGGRFAGIMRIGKRVHAIVIAPKWTETYCFWRTNNSLTTGPCSRNDGLANTRAMDPSEHPAAKYCLSLGVDGCNDYYLLAYDELEVCYRYLKPGLCKNFVNWASLNKFLKTPESGFKLPNQSSIPLGNVYTDTNPKQTVVIAFCKRNSEAFNNGWYWTSTASSEIATRALTWGFIEGVYYEGYQHSEALVRAARRIYIDLE